MCVCVCFFALFLFDTSLVFFFFLFPFSKSPPLLSFGKWPSSVVQQRPVRVAATLEVFLETEQTAGRFPPLLSVSRSTPTQVDAWILFLWLFDSSLSHSIAKNLLFLFDSFSCVRCVPFPISVVGAPRLLTIGNSTNNLSIHSFIHLGPLYSFSLQRHRNCVCCCNLNIKQQLTDFDCFEYLRTCGAFLLLCVFSQWVCVCVCVYVIWNCYYYYTRGLPAAASSISKDSN